MCLSDMAHGVQQQCPAYESVAFQHATRPEQVLIVPLASLVANQSQPLACNLVRLCCVTKQGSAQTLATPTQAAYLAFLDTL